MRSGPRGNRMQDRPGHYAEVARDNLMRSVPRLGSAGRMQMTLIEQARKEAETLALSAHAVAHFIQNAVDRVGDAYRAMHPGHGESTTSPPIAGETLWSHQDVLRLLRTKREPEGVDLYGLTDVAHWLLANPWVRLDELEWAVVNALIFHELLEFSKSCQVDGTFVGALAYGVTGGKTGALIWVRRLLKGIFGLIQLGVAGLSAVWGWERAAANDLPAWCAPLLAAVAAAASGMVFGLPLVTRLVGRHQRRRVGEPRLLDGDRPQPGVVLIALRV